MTETRPLICHITSVHPALDIRIFQKECRSLAQAGFRVCLVAPHTRSETIQGVEIIAIPRATRRLQRMTLTALRAYREARKLRAQLYHFHDHELILIGLLLTMRGYRVIYDSHEDAPRALFAPGRDYLPSFLKRPASYLFERIENFAVRHFAALIAATPAIARRFRNLQPNTEIVNNYPLREELVLSRNGAWTNRECAVAYVGSMSVERGLREMVQAIACLPPDLGARLKLAGAFSSPRQRDIATSLQGWRDVDELGFLDRRSVADLLGSVRAGLVLFHPIANHTEAQPNKFFEYMSAGIPVIVSDFPLWRDLIDKERCGIAVNPLDVHAIAEAIRYILIHPDEAEAMGRRGQQAVQRQYNWTSEERKLVELYARVLS